MGSDGETVQKVDPSTVTVENGFVTKADGYTMKLIQRVVLKT